jgi:integrase
MAQKPVATGRAGFDEWAINWIQQRWGNKEGRTIKLYRRYFLRWQQYLDELGITVPSAITSEVVLDYLPWRKAHHGERNTAIYEIKFFAQLLDEAKKRGYARENAARDLHLKLSAVEHKRVWTDEQVRIAIEAAGKADRFGWLHVALLMGKYQAVRFGQCQVPLDCIDLNSQVINYPAEIMKGGKPHTQPIDPEFTPVLKEIVAHRRGLKKTTLADLPLLRGVEMRKFLDSLGPEFSKLSHHGLRATWITEAALCGISETFAKLFVDHASTEVHEIYQRIGAKDLRPMFEKLIRNK